MATSKTLIANKLRAYGLVDEEIDHIWYLCTQSAKQGGSSAETIFADVLSWIVGDSSYLPELRRTFRMDHTLTITTRELKEIDHALYYAQNLAHGTSGHNQLMLIAKMAEHLGFHFSDHERKLEIPSGVVVDDGPVTGHSSRPGRGG